VTITNASESPTVMNVRVTIWIATNCGIDCAKAETEIGRDPGQGGAEHPKIVLVEEQPERHDAEHPEPLRRDVRHGAQERWDPPGASRWGAELAPHCFTAPAVSPSMNCCWNRK
jgi:hypothetical protein